MKAGYTILIFLLVNLIISVGCKKKTNPSPSGYAPYDSGIVGIRTWTGRKVSLAYDTINFVHYVSDTVTFSMAIVLINDKTIVNTYAYNSPDTLYYSSLDTAAKTITFESGNQWGYGTYFASISDSIVYNYSKNSIYWNENYVESMNSYSYYLHSP